jgi:hypothetical protein
LRQGRFVISKAGWRFAIKLVTANVVICGALLITLNLFSLAALKLYRGVRDSFSAQPVSAPEPWELPVYPDRDHAQAIFREFREEIDTRYEPFIGWSRLPFRGRTTTINEQGDRVHPAPPRQRTLRIARFFGGSTMWGTGVDDRGTIPARFNELNPEFEVHNHGETAFTSRQSLDRLINLVTRRESIDLVVFFDGVNDVLQQCRTGIPVPGHGRVLQIREALEQLDDGPQCFRHVAYSVFAEHSVELGQAALRKVGIGDDAGGDSGLEGYDCLKDRAKADAVAENLIETWRVARGIVTAEGGEFLAILQPHAHFGSPRLDHLNGSLDPEVGATLAAVYPLIRERVRRSGHSWIHDLSRAFDRDETGNQFILIDDFHASSSGNEVIAARIDRLVRGQGPGR